MTTQLQMMTALARTVRGEIVAAIPSRVFGRLRRSFRYIVRKDRVTIYSIYYWVRWVNDGRRAIKLPKGRVMVFFDPAIRDPRIAGDYPRTPADLRKLDPGKHPGVIFTRQVKAAKGLHFLEEGIRRSRRIVPNATQEMIRGDVRKLLRRATNKITVSL